MNKKPLIVGSLCALVLLILGSLNNVVGYNLNNQNKQKDVNPINKNDTINNVEIIQDSTVKCDCENKNATRWSFPILCVFLYPLYIFGHILSEIPFGYHYFLYALMLEIGESLNCYWEPTTNK